MKDNVKVESLYGYVPLRPELSCVISMSKPKPVPLIKKILYHKLEIIMGVIFLAAIIESPENAAKMLASFITSFAFAYIIVSAAR